MVQTDAKGETGATMERMVEEEGTLPERSEWFRSRRIIGTSEEGCVMGVAPRRTTQRGVKPRTGDEAKVVFSACA